MIAKLRIVDDLQSGYSLYALLVAGDEVEQPTCHIQISFATERVQRRPCSRDASAGACSHDGRRRIKAARPFNQMEAFQLGLGAALSFIIALIVMGVIAVAWHYVEPRVDE